MHHAFILFQTEDNMWWTIEKDGRGILLRMGDNNETLLKRVACTQRAQPRQNRADSRGKGSFYDLLEWIHKSRQLNMRYLLWNGVRKSNWTNCIAFAAAVYNQFSLDGNYVPPSLAKAAVSSVSQLATAAANTIWPNSD
jgi:hypothetical protein